MKSKLNDYFGCGTFITVLRWWWNENHWSCSYVDKVMCWQWHRMVNFIPAQLTCRPHYTFPILLLWVMDVGSTQQRTASIVQVMMQCMRTGFAFSTVFWPCFSASSLSYHFGSRFVVTTWSQILQLLQTGAEIWAQLCSCPECWVHTVCCWWSWPKHMFTWCPHGMKWMTMQTFYWVGLQPGESYADCENGWATSC